MSKHLPDADDVSHAADIMCKTAYPHEIYFALRRWYRTGGAGLYRSWLHVDDRPGRMEWVGSQQSGQFVVAQFLASNPEGVLA